MGPPPTDSPVRCPTGAGSACRASPRTHGRPRAGSRLSLLADELKKIDPPAVDGYIGFIGAEFLDRWLW